jgi:cation:H+ antiporter
VLLGTILLIAGLTVLAGGSELLVRGSVRLSHRLKIPMVIVGVVVVGFGTSAPEMAVSVLASVRGQGGIALGNLVGSNIANIALVLAVMAVICPVPISRPTLMRDIPLIAGGTIVFSILLIDRTLGRWDGALLVGLFILIIVYMVYKSFQRPTEVGKGVGETAPDIVSSGLPYSSLILMFGGLGGVLGGAYLMVDGATRIALILGISEEIVGLTIVAVGTSLPELGAAVASARHKVHDLTIGNVMGSNLFNILAISGLAGLARPISVTDTIRLQSIPFLLGATVLLFPLIWPRYRIGRWKGVLLLGVYALFVVFILV